MKKIAFACLVSLAVALTAAADAAAPTPASPASPVSPTNGMPTAPDIPIGLTNSTPLTGWPERPEKFKKLSERLDYYHQSVEPALRPGVRWLDTRFQSETNGWVDTPSARFRLFLRGHVAYLDSWEAEFRPKIDADLELPNLERHWNIRIRSSLPSELSEADRESDRSETRIGLRRLLKDWNLSTEVGLKVRIPPRAYVRLAWARLYTRHNWVFLPSQRIFYDTEEGLGEVTSLAVHRWIGGCDYLQSFTAARLSESTIGLEFEQTFAFGRIHEALEAKARWDQVPGIRDFARGWVVRGSVYARTREGFLSGYRLAWDWRRPAYKQWAYLQIGPDVYWSIDEDWKPEYRLNIGLDLLFWGSRER